MSIPPTRTSAVSLPWHIYSWPIQPSLMGTVHFLRGLLDTSNLARSSSILSTLPSIAIPFPPLECPQRILIHTPSVRAIWYLWQLEKILPSNCIDLLAPQLRHAWSYESLHQVWECRKSVHWVLCRRPPEIEQNIFHKPCLVKYLWSKNDDTPQFTGIPADIMIMAEFESLKKKMKQMSCDVQEGFASTLTRELDSQGVWRPEYQQSNEIPAKLDTILHQSDDGLASQLPQISTGANGNSTDFGDVEALYKDDDEKNEVVIPIVQHTSEGQLLAAQQAAQQDWQVRQKTSAWLKKRQFLMGYHCNHLRPLPSNWVYPKQMVLDQLINLCLLGSPKENILPLKTLSPCLVYHFNKKECWRLTMKQSETSICFHIFAFHLLPHYLLSYVASTVL